MISPNPQGLVPRALEAELRASAREYPVVTILGPRQSGKTTLARAAFPHLPWVSLEDPDMRLAAQADPRGFLGQWPEGVILDEVQRLPELLSYLQGMVDRAPTPGKYLLTGSHQPALQEAIAQSLAGRTAVLTLWPFSLTELRHYGPLASPFALILKGFYPRVHQEQINPQRFFSNYLQTYVERDVRALIRLRDLGVFQKFLVLLAGRTGQVINYAALSNDVGVSAATIREWISVLKASFVVIELQPYFENIQKRVIKSSKIYFADVGLAAYLLGITEPAQLERDPLRGVLYENMVVAEAVKLYASAGRPPALYFYRDSHGNEVDLLLRTSQGLHPVEIKSSSTFTPEFFKGLRYWQSLGVRDSLPGTVLYNGDLSHAVHGMRIENPLRLEAGLAALFPLQ
ncbi:MAG: ATP-binding protein [Burkholderiaceae bacterium]